MDTVEKEVKPKKEPKVKLEYSEEYLTARDRKVKKSKYYIITSEQNETEIHMAFYRNLLSYANFLNAEVLDILLRYENPTSIYTERQRNLENWSKITTPYHCSSRLEIHKYLTILADTKVRPTSKYPLRGLGDMTDCKSTIVGATKLHLESMPVLEGSPKKILLTTGCITVPNYTDSALGAMAKNNHKLGFVIVEIKDEETFYIRQVEGIYNPGEFNDGSFIDLCYSVISETVSLVEKAKGIVYGDSHYPEVDPQIDKENDKMADYFKVDNVVFHDVVDGESVNNHIYENPVEQFKRITNNKHSIKIELTSLGKWMKKKIKYKPVIVQSNHNDRFDRYLITNDWRKDLINSVEYFKYLNLNLLDKLPKGVVAYFLDNMFKDKIKCLAHDESFKIGKFECAVHGHVGSNGARGSKIGFNSLNIPMITAHSHSVYRADDYLVTGTNTPLKLSYNKGASNWIQSNVIIHTNDTAQHLIFIKGHYTTFFD